MARDLSSASDAELLALCHSRGEAFAVFYRRYERLVAGWLMRQTNSPELAADLTAEAFAAAYLAAPRFRDGPEPAAAWLLGIARNKLLRSLRKDRAESSSRRRIGMQRPAISDESLAAISELADRDLVELLDGLPTQLREAVRARVLEELEYRELAERLGVSEQAARKRVSRGLSALRRRAQQPGVGL